MRMPGEYDVADRRSIDGRANRPYQVAHVDERVRRVEAADERHEASRGDLEDREQRAIARAIDDARPNRRPAQTVDPGDGAFAAELAASVGVDRRRRIFLGARRSR